MELDGWDIAAALAKAISYAATLGAAGGIFFLGYSSYLIDQLQRARIRRLISCLLGVAILASVAKLLLLAGSMSGEWAGMFDREFTGMILRAGEGRATAARLAGMLLIFAGLVADRRFHGIAVLGALLAATSFAWVGHVHGLKYHGIPMLFLCVHLLCAAFWLGALVPLLIVARDCKTRQIAALASLFGKIGLTAVALLLAAGVVLLSRLIGAPSDLWTSDYGRMVSLKLFLVAALLSLAAINKLQYTPRLLKGDAAAVQGIRGSIKAEIVLGGLILLVTAAFTTLIGPAQ